MWSTIDTRSLFKADATFEAIYGTTILAGAAAGVLTRSDIPVGQAVILGTAVGFLLASVSQLAYFINSPRRVLLELAIGNVGMAVAGLIWLGVDHRFSGTGATVLSIGFVCKLSIGILQARSLGIRSPSRPTSPERFETCEHCDAPVESTQRYCVVCGTRRRHVHDPAARFIPQATASSRAASAQPGPPPGSAAGDRVWERRSRSR